MEFKASAYPLSRSSPRLSGSALGSPVAAACFQVAIGLSAFPASVTANQLPNHPNYHFIQSFIVELRVTHFDILCRRRILDRLSFLGLGFGEPSTSWTYGSDTSDPRKGCW
ncbi:uncharacterized protein P884DRAFT_301981 [Thermothelomyces heterothallicus CBS 202.75]|uniref:uncharacterized protein n=1 Tax=Thermothelomyces heterothallicus CBS 202.75 TaxID=1149848 RepID=UPI00374245B1